MAPKISPDKSLLPDIQATHDQRGIHIKRVGITNVLFPVKIPIKSGGFQEVNAKVSLYSSLEPELKGTNMSRFVESLTGNGENLLTPETLFHLLERMHEKLETDDVYARFDFTLVRDVAAPVTHKVAPQGYGCAIVALSNREHPSQLMYEATVPVSTVCPCSKEMSIKGKDPDEKGNVPIGRGAHNQRTYVRCRVLPNGGASTVYFEDIIDTVEEEGGSVRLFPLLKRPDEKWVTEVGYDNPKFVEDVARDTALAFNDLDFISEYDIRAESDESIHHHNALAYVESDGWEGALS